MNDEMSEGKEEEVEGRGRGYVIEKARERREVGLSSCVAGRELDCRCTLY